MIGQRAQRVIEAAHQRPAVPLRLYSWFHFVWSTETDVHYNRSKFALCPAKLPQGYRLPTASNSLRSAKLRTKDIPTNTAPSARFSPRLGCRPNQSYD